MANAPPSSDEYSAAATLVPFPRPLPLLRGPITAGPLDDPDSGPFLLAFKSPRAWAAAYSACKSQLISQCESGARIGCSISASAKCQPPWWKFFAKQDLKVRAECEEREMEACFAAARERCGGFAREKCESAFRDARIGSGGLGVELVDRKVVFRLISGLCCTVGARVRVWDVDECWGEFWGKLVGVTNVRGRDLLGCGGDVDIESYLRKCS